MCGFFLLISCTNENEMTEDTRFRFVPAEESGINFSNNIRSTAELNILNYLYFYNGAGVAAADFNNDGFIDLYFCSNQGADELYINKGQLNFTEVSGKAGISGQGWSTGVSTVDINNDGLLDIYVCEVGKYKSLQGHNRLYVNQGVGEDGIPKFSEEAAKYGLDFSGLSTQSAFFDYDLDGDLDMFLMNHSVHPNSNYGIGERRAENDSLSGDRLFQNENGRFVDVSEESGIFSGKIGYGLGLAIGDLNNDGYPDIYVGNDFFENDYTYINQGNGTFKDLVSVEDSGIKHTSHYTMGVDIADFNNDGLQDVISLDMLPEDLTTYKASGTDYSYHIYNNYLNKGYANQYMQNALQLNQGDTNFSEIAHFSGVAATEWSWAPLFADLDNDGFKDLFITNGILGATNDMDYISFIANENIQKRLNQGISDKDLEMIREIPEKKTVNYFFRNKGGLEFEKVNAEWIQEVQSFSNGAAYADLDNDGDLDLITNNVNEKAFLYQNFSRDNEHNNFLKLRFEGPDDNRSGIGASVTLYSAMGVQTLENFTTRGFLSAMPPVMHFGLGNSNQIDSLIVRWPGGQEQLLKDVESNQALKISFKDAAKIRKISNSFAHTDQENIDLELEHREYSFRDFLYEPLIPYSQSNLGPAILVIDFNNDGRQELFVSGDQFSPGLLWQQDAEGNLSKTLEIDSDSREPTDQVFFDADNDSDLDLLMVFGGSDPNNRNKNIPKLYLNENSKLIEADLPISRSINASFVRAGDFNNDGLQDILIGSNAEFGSYGKSQGLFLYLNQGKLGFSEPSSFKTMENQGMLYDARVLDINNDGFQDIVLAGHYMPITILLNDSGGGFYRKEIMDTEGWWYAIQVADIDDDGDQDIIAGNWGLNSRLKASKQNPMQLYLNDFDDNGKIDPILTYFYQGRETPLATKDELSKQIPSLNKSFLSYTEFAKADFNDYFSSEKIRRAEKKKVYTLETSCFINDGNMNFSKRALPREVQFSSVHAIKLTDLDNDGLEDLVLAGNNYHVNTQLGRQDAGYGLMLRNIGEGRFELFPEKLYVKGAVKAIDEIKINDVNYLIFGINNKKIEFIKYPTLHD